MIQHRRGSRGIPLFPLFNQREKLVQFIYHSAPPPKKQTTFYWQIGVKVFALLYRIAFRLQVLK